MRPRVFPAEDLLARSYPVQNDLASMRPRVFPAEDPPRASWRPPPDRCFNEAAGIPRGRPGTGVVASRNCARFNEAAGIPRGRRPGQGDRRARQAASMRPRVFPAEDAGNTITVTRGGQRLQ